MSKRRLLAFVALLASLGVSGCGGGGAEENIPGATATGATAPSAPTGLTAAAASSSQINLSWTAAVAAVTIATEYEVYRDGTLVATPGSVTTYNDTGLAASTTYTYTVRAVGGNGKKSGHSKPVTGTTAPDTTAPVISNGQPSGILASGTTQTAMSVTTNENATCRWGTTNVAYGSLPNTFTTTGSTSHSTTLNGLADGQSYTRYVRCQDGANPPNANTSSTAISFSVANTPDTTAPVISNGQPSGILASGTTQTAMSVTTNENATCRWGTTNVAYGSLPNTFTTTGSTSHSTTLNGLADGQSYTRYVRCQDGANPPNANTSSTAISFSVANAPDTTEPVISNGQPSGILASGTTQTAMSVTTNENATCRWGTTNVAYGSLPNTFTTTGSTSHSTTLNGLADGQSYTRYVRCQDGANPPNANTSSTAISFSVANTPDTTAPVISNGQPSGILASGTTQTAMSVTTNENATCRWGTTNVAYGSLPNTFTTTGSTSHSTTLNGLADGQSYTRYVRCQDGANPPNANTSSTAISFSVANTPDTTAPVISGGAPTGTLAAGTTQVTMSVSTNENAMCKWDTSAATSYAAMPNTFTTAGGAFHSTLLSGLVNGQSYTRYVRCQDGANNANTSSYTVSFSVGTGAGPISLSLVPSRTSGVAPLAVFFDATGTTDVSVTSRPFHDLEYRWDFGDPAGGATWSRGSRAGVSSKNSATGPVAAHVFETPGTYTVTLSVFDGTNTDITNVTITVDNADNVFAASNTICIGATTIPVGGVGGCPAGALGLQQASFSTAINSSISAGKRRMLFKRGDTFTSTSDANIAVTGPGIIGAFGTTGNAPIVNITGNNNAFMLSDKATPTIKDWRIMDLQINGNSGVATQGFNTNGGINQVTLLRLNIHHVHVGFRFSPSILDYYNSNGDPGHTTYDQLAIVDCTVNTIIGGSSGNGAFISSQRFAFMGNEFSDTTAGEHVVRLPYTYKGVLSNNTLSNPASTKHTVKMHATQFSFQPTIFTEQIVLSDNKFTGGTGSAWVVAIGPEDSTSDERVKNVIVERNWFAPQASTQRPLYLAGVEQARIRNNLFDLTGNQSQVGAGVVQRGIEPAPTNNEFYHNTFYSDSTGNFFGVIFSDGTGHVAKNNLGYAPNSTSRDMISGTATDANNTSDAGILVSPSFASATPSVPVDFTLGSGSNALNQGAPVPVFSDFFRLSRPQNGGFDLGAIERP